jgi:hypothetical protein
MEHNVREVSPQFPKFSLGNPLQLLKKPSFSPTMRRVSLLEADLDKVDTKRRLEAFFENLTARGPSMENSSTDSSNPIARAKENVPRGTLSKAK